MKTSSVSSDVVTDLVYGTFLKNKQPQQALDYIKQNVPEEKKTIKVYLAEADAYRSLDELEQALAALDKAKKLVDLQKESNSEVESWNPIIAHHIANCYARQAELLDPPFWQRLAVIKPIEEKHAALPSDVINKTPLDKIKVFCEKGIAEIKPYVDHTKDCSFKNLQQIQVIYAKLLYQLVRCESDVAKKANAVAGIEKIYRELIIKNPENVTAFYEHAAMLAREGNTTAALQIAEAGLAKNPGNPRLKRFISYNRSNQTQLLTDDRLVNDTEQKHDRKKPLSELERQLDEDELDDSRRLILTHTIARTNPEKALTHFQQLHEKDFLGLQDLIQYAYCMRTVSYSKQDLTERTRWLETIEVFVANILTRDEGKNNSKALHLHGLLIGDLGFYSEAFPIFSDIEARFLSPAKERAAAQHGFFLSKAKKHQEAINLLDTFIQSAPHDLDNRLLAKLHANKGTACIEIHDLATAEQAFITAMELNENNHTAISGLNKIKQARENTHAENSPSSAALSTASVSTTSSSSSLNPTDSQSTAPVPMQLSSPSSSTNSSSFAQVARQLETQTAAAEEKQSKRQSTRTPQVKPAAKSKPPNNKPTAAHRMAKRRLKKHEHDYQQQSQARLKAQALQAQQAQTQVSRNRYLCKGIVAAGIVATVGVVLTLLVTDRISAMKFTP